YLSRTHLRPLRRSHLFPYTTLFRSTSVNCSRFFVTSGKACKEVKQVCRCERNTDKYIQQDQKDSALNPKFGRQSIDRHDDHNFRDRKSTRLNSSHVSISYAVFCLKK